MTRQEVETLKTLDRKVDASPNALTCRQVNLYRSLLIKYVAEAGTRGMPNRQPGPMNSRGRQNHTAMISCN